jgi:hypothetical protein
MRRENGRDVAMVSGSGEQRIKFHIDMRADCTISRYKGGKDREAADLLWK